MNSATYATVVKLNRQLVDYVITSPNVQNHFSVACAKVKLLLEHLRVNTSPTNSEFKKTEFSSRVEVSLTHYSAIWSFYMSK